MASNVSFAVDVSGNQPSHQPWKSFGVHLGFAKASEGQHTRDAWFGRHIADIKADGLIPAGYHFAWPNQSAAVEAANYLGAVAPAVTGTFVHALDLERNPEGTNWGGTVAQKRAYAKAWIAAVKKEHPNGRVLIYLSKDSIAAGMLPGNQDGVWYPAYPVQGRSFAQAATIARPTVAGHQVWGWQFASVPRDQTVIYMSPADLRVWAAGTITPQQEDGMADWKTPLTIKAGQWSEKDYTAPADFWLMLANIKAGRAQTAAEDALAQARANGTTLTTLTGKVGGVALTDAQVAAVADRLGANPTFVNALADRLAADLAARMQS